MEANFDQVANVSNVRRPTFFDTLQAAAKTASLHWYDAADGIDYPLESQWLIGRIFHAFTDGALHWMRKVIPSGSGGTFAGNCVRVFAGFVQEAEPKHVGDETADGDGNVLAHDGALWINPVNGLARVQDNTNQPDATDVLGVQARWVPQRPPIRVASHTTTSDLDVATTHASLDATGGNITVTLPDATACAQLSLVVRITNGGNAVTVDAAVGNVNGGATWTPANGDYLVYSDGTNWLLW